MLCCQFLDKTDNRRLPSAWTFFRTKHDFTPLPKIAMTQEDVRSLELQNSYGHTLSVLRWSKWCCRCGLDKKKELKVGEGEVKKAVCARHPDRCVVLYCRDCSQPTCETCFIQQHNGHRYASIDEVADQLRSQLDDVLDRVRTRTSAVSHQLDTVEDYRSQLTNNLQVVSINLLRVK